MNKILILYPNPEPYKEQILALCRDRLEPVFLPFTCDRSTFLKELPQAEVIIGDPKPEWLTEAPLLKWLQISWAGVGPFVRAPHLQDKLLTNASGAFGVTIAEHAMGLLLALSRNLPIYIRTQSKGLWQDAGSEWALAGKKALILGCGDLGSQLAKRLAAFDVEITGYVLHPRKAASPFSAYITLEDLDRVLPETDLIFGCLPDTPGTRNLLSRERIDLLKKDAIVINCGRGTLLDTMALTERLKAGTLFGAGLDVTDPEPLPAGHPLYDCSNVIITPHVAGIGFGHLPQTEKKIWEIALTNLSLYLSDAPLTNVVRFSEGY